MKLHEYNTTINWQGNLGSGTSSYTSYTRNFEISNPFKSIAGSSDPSFRGDPNRYNPEELLLAAVSSCHMLWYLHFCSVANIVVINYSDSCKGTMIEAENGSGHFQQITLFPKVQVQDSSMIVHAIELHHKAHEFCFIANSVNFPIEIQSNCYI